MKVCPTCHQLLPLDCFHLNRTKKFGRHTHCKKCVKKRGHDYGQKNPQKALNKCYRWRETENGKTSVAKNGKKMREKYPEKYRARMLLNNAITLKRIERPNICNICHVSNKRIVAHHKDYSKPLDVVWCCDQCHKLLDANNKYDTVSPSNTPVLK